MIRGCEEITISDTVFANVANVYPGDRLAALALKHDYAKSVIYSGPRFLSANAKANSVEVSFERIDKGLETSGHKAPNWFEIAATDKKIVNATAKVVGNKVVVTSPDIAEPKFIRMAWNNIAELNLRDKNS